METNNEEIRCDLSGDDDQSGSFSDAVLHLLWNPTIDQRSKSTGRIDNVPSSEGNENCSISWLFVVDHSDQSRLQETRDILDGFR